MAYYDALIAKWAQAPAGTTQQKLDWVNAQKVTGDAITMRVPYMEIYNRLNRAEFNALTAANQEIVRNNITVETVDYSPGSETRRLFNSIFTPGGASLTALAPYVATFDTPQVPWPTATVAQGGGGLRGMVAMSDLKAAGII